MSTSLLLMINDILILVLLICLLRYVLSTHRKIGKKIVEVNKGQVLLTNYKNGLVINVRKLEKAFRWIHKDFEEKTKMIANESKEKIENIKQNVNYLSEKNLAVLKQRDEIMQELDNRADPLKASLQKSVSQIRQFQEGVNRQLEEYEKQLTKMTQDLKHFRGEIQRMKDCIRERTIDFEL